MDAETPPLPPPPRSFNLRKTGLVVGASVFLLGLGVIGLLIAFGGSKRTQPTPPSVPKDKLAAGDGAQPSTVDLGGPSGINISELQNAKVQFVDRNDPTRIMAMLQWSRLEPIDASRASVVDPVAYYYLKSGALVQIKAAKGRIYTPPKQTEPESGTFDGGVTMSLFEPDASNKIDITKDRPAGTLTTNSINFDVGMGELSAPGLVKINSEPIQAQGKGVRLLFNQVAQQLELLQVDEQGQITILPDKVRKRQQASRTGAAEAPSESAAPSKPIVYRSVFEEGVKIDQGPRAVRADGLEIFMRLLDGKLPSDTFSGGAAPPELLRDTAAPAAPNTPATNQPTQLDQPIAMSWTGKLTVRPLKAEPTELTSDHLFVRLSGEKSGPAKIEDTSVRATALAPIIEYGVTSRDVNMTGPASNPVVLALAGSGAIRSPRVQLNVGTGIGTLAGEGQIASLANVTDPKKVDRIVKWKGLASIQLATRNGWTNGQLRAAQLTGGVTAISKSGLMTGDLLNLSFRPGASGREELSMVSVRNNVRVQAGQDADGSDKGFMTADAIDVALEQLPGTNDPVPTHLIAQGEVTAGRGDQQLAARWVSASLDRMTRTDSAGVQRADVEPSILHARGDVRFANGRNLQVRADTLDADVPKQLVFLEGREVSIVRDSAKITGTDMQIDGLARDLLVSGPGRFDYSRPAKGATDNGGTVEATWINALHIDDRTGQARAFGSAKSVASLSAEELDRLTADTLVIRFDPRPEVAAAKVDSAPRNFLGAEAFGSTSANTNAQVESRRFAPGVMGASDPSLWQRLVKLESSRIILDAAQGTLSVPQAGKLLVSDRRPGGTAPDASQGIGSLQLSGARGNTLFSWQGDLTMRKSTGAIDLHRQARMLHQPQGQSAPLILDADNMNALVVTSGAGNTDQRAQLQRATCDGSVYLRSPDDQQTLSADALIFNALTNTAEAESRSSNNVVLADKAKPAPLQARKLSWKMGPGGEVRVIEPASVIAPQ